MAEMKINKDEPIETTAETISIEDIPVEQPQVPNNVFQIQLPMIELRKRSLFLAVPMYGGQCSGMFARSFGDLAVKCAVNGIQLQVYFLFNESLITRARNYCVDEFMRSGRSHLMFVDSDIGFNPDDVIALLAMQSPSPDDTWTEEYTNDKGEIVAPQLIKGTPYDVIGAAYPKKCISWEKVKLAVDKGVADQNPNELEKFVGDYVFNPRSGRHQIPIGMPVEVAELGTGFMMIRRRTFELFAEQHKEYLYKPDHVRTEHFDGSREITQFFQAEIDLGNTGYVDASAEVNAPAGTYYKKVEDATASKRYLSEDYWFCYKLQKMGLKTWLCPWMQLQHVGTYVFGGSLAALASIGASATADPSALKKGK